MWVWAGLIAAGVAAALLAGASVANAQTESDPGPRHLVSRSTDSDATASDAAARVAKRVHGILSRHRLEPTRTADSQRSPSANEATPASTTPRPLGVLRDRLSAERATTVAPTRSVGSLIGGIRNVVNKVGSLAFDSLQAVETVITGPPKVPPNSTVTVHTSTVQLSNGQTVPANWYFPETDNGEPPDQMILLQHGFLALGPMYSYTAANLAEQTNSVVVTPTLSSNPFAGDDYWLGGTGMAASIADLFNGDRTALTESAIAAGYAEAYPGATQLPQKFALEGHSLGANLVSGAAGFIVADTDAGDDLVGVILLDGVPIGNTLPDALTKLDYYEAHGGHYIPVREIGAPFNAFNSLSTVNDDLTSARPDNFNGVVLEGGVHMDSMRGGNQLIQFAAYLVAGIPQPQNPPAVDQLSVTWLNDWFANGDDGVDDGPAPGSTVVIATPKGTAHGVVIGASHPQFFAEALRGIVPSLFAAL
jgi:hypothetical protein